MPNENAFDLEALIQERPKLHFNSQGERVSWGISPEVLRFLNFQIGPGQETVETGAGLSTICFVGAGCRHLSIMPDPRIEASIREKCGQLGLDQETLSFEIAKSQEFLPTMKDKEFDLALIDGDHAFPIPYFDYYYFSKALKIGGILVIDDVLLWTGQTLKQFLMLEAEWDFVADLSANACAFRKIKSTAVDKGWGGQIYQVVNSVRVAREIWDIHLPKLQK